MSRLCQETPGRGSHLAGSCHFRANELCSFPQIFCHKSWSHAWTFGELANLTFPAANENSSATSPGSGQQIGNSVSDHVAFVQGCLQVCSSLFQEADLRFAATATLSELSDSRFRMVQAVIDTIDVPAFHANL